MTSFFWGDEGTRGKEYQARLGNVRDCENLHSRVLRARDVCRYVAYFECFFWRTDAASAKDAQNVSALLVTIFVTFRGMVQKTKTAVASFRIHLSRHGLLLA